MSWKMADGNNMPVQSPLIPDPFVPYRCPGNRTLYAVCRADPDAVRAFLAPTPFEYVEDRFVLSIVDFGNCDKVPFMDAAIVVPVRYGDMTGGHYVLEYENNDAAIAAGRELWGYPKKYARIALEQDGDTVTGRVVRDGVALMTLTVDLDDEATVVARPRLNPHLNVHAQPAPDGPGIIAKRVIARDTSPDFELISERAGRAEVALRGTGADPVHAFGPAEVLGGGLVTGDFYATEENGWGRIVETLYLRDAEREPA